jgi:hypothetical protein
MALSAPTPIRPAILTATADQHDLKLPFSHSAMALVRR